MPMLPAVRNLFAEGPESSAEALGSKDEVILPLIEGHAFRLEQIVSNGAFNPAEFWYDQDTPEWVALVRGQAVLEFEDGRLELKAGDTMVIPARLKHRVAQASADAVWLALHFTESAQTSA